MDNLEIGCLQLSGCPGTPVQSHKLPKSTVPKCPSTEAGHDSSDTAPSDDTILCYYVNATDQFQMVRSDKQSTWSFEQAVLPGGQLLFEAPRQEQVEIYISGISTAMLEETIACDRLRIHAREIESIDSLPSIQVQNVQLCA
ncbi:MAG: DUF1830 domain-containing protein [Synechococcales bacterium]|nr:DUF1830 domain-containing protein [Synechococcales bacterium]